MFAQMFRTRVHVVTVQLDLKKSWKEPTLRQYAKPQKCKGARLKKVGCMTKGHCTVQIMDIELALYGCNDVGRCPADSCVSTATVW
jgi:hypothetical protein